MMMGWSDTTKRETKDTYICEVKGQQNAFVVSHVGIQDTPRGGHIIQVEDLCSTSSSVVVHIQ